MGEPSSELKAIETRYDGYLFRSRLEARWAVVFNTLGIPYEYEPEGFNCNGLWYLPDFWLPEQKFFFEVKGPFTDNKGPEKAAALANASKRMVYLFGNIPGIDDLGRYDNIEGTAYYPFDGIDYDYMWCRKSCCGKYGIHYHGRSGRIICDCPHQDTSDTECTPNVPPLRIAFLAARQHRFDRGGK